MELQTHELVPHPAYPPRGVNAFSASLSLRGKWLRIRWRWRASHTVEIPGFAGKGRADGLWQTTCFELFVREREGPGYAEFNFSPSERWAAYDFDDYRAGMRERPMPVQPVCTIRQGRGQAIFDVELPLAALPPLPAEVAVTAILEQQGGGKSYWAIAHPPERPDFHDPACFAARLEPRERP